LPSETMIWQPEFTDKTLSRKPGAVQTDERMTRRESLRWLLQVTLRASSETAIRLLVIWQYFREYILFMVSNSTFWSKNSHNSGYY
ncbi:hypothetical protein MZE34_22980, partial [Escherichia coli]